MLSEYEAELTDEQKKELEAIVEKDDALEKAADMLDKNGNVTDAVYVQEEAIKVNFKNLDLYKTLGKLNDKAGKKNGVKLYVNGVAADTEPFVKKAIPSFLSAPSLRHWMPKLHGILKIARSSSQRMG